MHDALGELRKPGLLESRTATGETLTKGLTALADEVGIAAFTRAVGPKLQTVFADHEVENVRDFIRSSERDGYRDF